MAGDSYTSVGAEWHKEANRLFPRVSLFGLLLILSHVLKITPSSVDLGGIKINVEDVVIIHGGIALVFFYYLWNLIGASISGHHFLPLNTSTRTMRSLVRTARKPYRNDKTKRMALRTPKEAKRWVWWVILATNLFVSPYWLAFLGITILAMVLGVPDVWNFGDYLWTKSFEGL